MVPSWQQGIGPVGGDSIMMWGVFTWHGFDQLVRLDTSLTGDCDVEVLRDHLHPFMDSWVIPVG